MTSTTQPLFNKHHKEAGILGYQKAGITPNKPVLVFIHGVGLQSAAWQKQIDFFCQDYSVYALDMPGHGLSSPIQSSGDISDYVTWLQDAMTTLNIAQANLVGHSMGALIAMGYAITYPTKVTRLALINSVFCRSPAVRAAVVERAKQIKQGPIDIKTPLQRWFDNSKEQQRISRLVANWLNDMNIRSYAQAYRAFATGDDKYADGLTDVVCPLVAITGSDDPNSTPAMSHAIANKAPNGKAFIVSEHRHMITMTAADQVNELLQQWLHIDMTDLARIYIGDN